MGEHSRDHNEASLSSEVGYSHMGLMLLAEGTLRCEATPSLQPIHLNMSFLSVPKLLFWKK